MLTFFAPSEANSLLPEVRSILQDLLKTKNQVATIRLEIERLAQQGRVSDSRPRSQLIQELIDQIQRGVGLLEEMGCIVRQIDEGIVDFPALRYGKQVYLCWRIGEPEVSYWHDMKSGFAGRAPITAAEVVKAYV